MDSAIQDKNVCDMFYSLHTDAPILKEAEEWSERILDTDYLKVSIDEMIDNLDINNDIKRKLKDTLKKFLTLFCGGLGKLSKEFPAAHIKLKEGIIPYKGAAESVQETYQKRDQPYDGNWYTQEITLA